MSIGFDDGKIYYDGEVIADTLEEFCLFKQIGFHAGIGMAWRAYATSTVILIILTERHWILLKNLMRGEIKMPMSKKEMQRRWAEKEAQRQNIIKNRDWNALFAMDENDDFSWALEQILWSFVTNGMDGNLDISNLNHTQKVLFLVMELENATQADTLLNFFDDGFAVYGREAVQALEEVGAYQCAAALSAVVDTLPNGIYPKGDKEFWDSLMSGKDSDIWDKADRVFVDYADGWFPDLCRTYAEAHRDTVQVG